jgi:hypothetical protein
MNYKWCDIDIETRRLIMDAIVRVSPVMIDIDMSILLWSIGFMEVPLDTLYNELAIKLFQALQRVLPSMSAHDVAKTIWGLSNTGLSWDDLPPAIKW